jgi:hypothetical protein
MKWKSRAANLLFWVLPLVFLVWLFQDGLRCWFINDDFAWLGLIRRLDSPGSLLRTLFEPAAQGTIRPWSERGFFLLFETLFGMDDLPFRIMAFATMAANLLLLTWIVRRITSSRLAGLIAATCWAANTALTTIMTWSSAYNEAMCACFILSAMALLIRYVETGRRLYWWLQLVVFSMGFGALEINVVYPAIAAAYILFVAPKPRRRSLLAGVVPLFVISVLYFLIHRAVAPLPVSGAYAIHLDSRIFKTLLLYSRTSLLPVDWTAFGHSRRLGDAVLWLSAAAIAALFALELRKGRTTVLFFAAWYLASLAPVLVLPDHFTDYYLTIPLLGLAMLFGYGGTSIGANATTGWGKWRYLVILPLAGYLTVMIPVSRSATRWWLNKTEPVRVLVLGVEAAHRRHPGKAILLDGIPGAVYDDSMSQGAFYPLHISDVYLTPGSEARITHAADAADPDISVLAPEVTDHAVENDQVVIYSFSGDHLRNITKSFERSAPNRFINRLPSRIDAGNPLYSWLLGPTWLLPESGVRWMPGEATVKLRGPDTPGNKIVLDGFYPSEQLNRTPRNLIVSVDGVRVGETQINNPESDFHRLFPVPDASVGKSAVEIEIRVDPMERRNGQSYGVVFGKIAIHP